MLMLFLTVAMVHLIALMSPGPDFFFVSQIAASRSRKEAMMGVIGITLGILAWAAVALMGLSLILQEMTGLYQVITFVGGLYLCWMSWQLLRSAYAKKQSCSDMPVTLPARDRTLARGLLTNLLNPKAIIYFGSVFSMFVDESVSGSERLGIFLLIVIETLTWFSLVALVFALPKMRLGYQRLAKWIDGLAGLVFLGFGVALIMDS